MSYIVGLVSVQAQDSLAVQRMRRLLTILPADTNRVRLLDSLCVQFHDNIPERGIAYGRQALALARHLHDQPGQLMSLLDLGACYANLSDSQYALQLYNQALRLARRTNSSDGLVSAYTRMAAVHYAWGDTATVWRLYRPALTLAYRNGVRRSTQITLFGNVGELLLDMNRPTPALQYLHRALLMARQSNNVGAQAVYTARLGSYYHLTSRYDTAEGLLRNAVELAQALQNSRIEADTRLQLSETLLARQQLTEAETHAATALQLARTYHHLALILAAYDKLAKIAAARHDFITGYDWQRRYQLFNDTLNNHDRLVALAALQQRYETKDKEQQIIQLTAHDELQKMLTRQLLATVLILAAGLASFSFLYLQLRRSRAALALNNLSLQQATDELQRLAASKDRLYAIVAHDLRGPVTSFAAVTGLIDFYLKQGDEEGLRRLPALVHQTTTSINHLLDNLLNWAVNENGELAFQPEPLAVAELFEEVAALYQTTAQTKQIAISVRCPAELLIWADRNMVRTILRNIVGNALKFSPVKSLVQLQATADPAASTALLSCTDSGPGMLPAQVAAYLSQDELPLPKRFGARDGTGLGLVLCRAFARRHNGTLHIDSQPGQGTTVGVVLSLASQA